MSYIFAGVCFIFVGIIFIQRNKFKLDKTGRDLFVRMGLENKEVELAKQPDQPNPIIDVLEEMFMVIQTRKRKALVIEEIKRKNEKQMSWYEKIITLGGYEII